jgi:hypothetical protein
VGERLGLPPDALKLICPVAMARFEAVSDRYNSL